MIMSTPSSEHTSLLSHLTVKTGVEQEKDEKETFTSSIGLVLTSLGATIGTGNIWRFPRIVAIHAAGGGALVFLMIWFCFLWLWSIPIVILEFAAGRFTRTGPIESANRLAGSSFRFVGGWIIFVGFAIGCYYSVLVGWCFYYFVYYLINDLPSDVKESNRTWDELQDSSWPVWCHLLAMVASALSVSKGVSTIEPMNKVVVPILLGIVLFSVYWAIFLPYAQVGIEHYFTPNWDSLTDYNVWLDAATQNAWDTAAATASFWTYAIFMKRTNGAVRVGTLIPIGNNCISFLCGMIMFSCVFSVLLRLDYGTGHILDIIGDNGPANTGLTFIWMPILYNNITGGRFLCALFFLCLTLASLSSMVAMVEKSVRVLLDYGIRRIPATIIVCIVIFFLGLGSALDINVLVNQDKVWGYALIVSGLFCVFMIYRYGVEKFRREAVNEYGIGDWKLPQLWSFMICVISPIQAVVILLWYYTWEIVDEDEWYKFTGESLIMVFSQWICALLILIGLNWWMKPLQYHPKDPTSCSHRILKFLIKSSTSEPIPAHQLSNTLTPDTSYNEANSILEYYQITRSNDDDHTSLTSSMAARTGESGDDNDDTKL